jgi:hypothetical protein
VLAILLESGVDGRADRQNVKMSVFPSADQARGPEATLTGEVSFLRPEAEAGESKP